MEADTTIRTVSHLTSTLKMPFQKVLLVKATDT